MKCPRCESPWVEGQQCPMCTLPGEVRTALVDQGWREGEVWLQWTTLADFDGEGTDDDQGTVGFLVKAQSDPIAIVPHWFLLTTENYLVAYAPSASWCPICKARASARAARAGDTERLNMPEPETDGFAQAAAIVRDCLKQELPDPEMPWAEAAPVFLRWLLLECSLWAREERERVADQMETIGFRPWTRPVEDMSGEQQAFRLALQQWVSRVFTRAYIAGFFHPDEP